MNFKGEVKFPDIDHPGVPATFVVEDDQAELVLEGESLGRWSLYDVQARRLVSAAFAIDLAGDEVTFIAADPIDFAYRGVEHMAKTWAEIKSKRLAGRQIAIRKSRRGVIPSRLDELAEAMRSNLATQRSPSLFRSYDRDKAPRVSEAKHEKAAPEPAAAEPATPAPSLDTSSAERELVSKQMAELEAERARLADERATLEAERLAAEEREANRVEAYRIEMKRLESEREEARRLTESARHIAPAQPEPEPVAEVEPVLPEPSPEPAPEVETESSEPEPTPPREPRPEADLPGEPEPGLEPEPAEPEPGLEPEPAVAMNLVDLSDLETVGQATPVEAPQPEPAMAGAPRDRGLMGAVKAAFARNGGKNHQHSFTEAPGGIGITRYVCEECGYVSISA